MGSPLEQLLESVADAISALVIFATESHEDVKMLKNFSMGVQGVKDSVVYFSGESQRTIELWRAKMKNDGK